MPKLLVDNKWIQAPEGTALLRACLDNGIYIPHLCHLKAKRPAAASCRLCFVEIEGLNAPVTACTVTVAADLVVYTDTPEVRRLQRTALRLLLSVHDAHCRPCPANKRCELQRLAKFLNVRLKPRRLQRYLKAPAVVSNHPCLDYYPNRCVLCGKCLNACQTRSHQTRLTLAHRGFQTVVSYYGKQDAAQDCPDCRQCVDVCPVGALVMRAAPADGPA